VTGGVFALIILLGFANGARFAGVVFKVKVLRTPYGNGLQMENLRQRLRLELPNRMRVDQITLEWKFHTLFRPNWELLNFQWLQLSGPMQVDGKTSE